MAKPKDFREKRGTFKCTKQEFLDSWALTIVSSPIYQKMTVQDAIANLCQNLGVEFKED